MVGVNLNIILMQLFQMMRSFLVLKLGKLQTLFGKKCANLSLKFRVLIIGEIEQQLFLSTGNFYLIIEKSLAKMTLDGNGVKH